MARLLFVIAYAVYAGGLAVAISRAAYRARPSRAQALSASPGVGPPPLRVLIVGATGGTGRELLAQALERGHTVTALARSPSRVELEHPRLRVIRGDVLDYPAVHAAVHGHDAVISALGHRRFWWPTRILSQGTANLLRAMEAHGVERFVCQTSLGLGDSVGRMGLYYTGFVIPMILPFYFWDKTRQERLIARSGVKWVIVRPGALTSGRKRASYRQGNRIGSLLWTVRISRADVADFMLTQLSQDAYIRTAVGVCW